MKEWKVFSIICVQNKPRICINASYKPNFLDCGPPFASSCQNLSFSIILAMENLFIILSLVKDAREQVQKTKKKA